MMVEITRLPKKLEEYLKQPGSRLTAADREFVRQVELLASRGVGYGFMQQVIEWIWQEKSNHSWGPEYFNKLLKEKEKCRK